jgi:peptidyl-prolyl cis-trans isomerase D
MMTKLREMTFIFIWILVIAFVALMVFEWGMDFSGIRSRPNIVGEIDGNKITIQDFQQAVQNAYQQEKQQSGQEPDEEKLSELRDQVWNQFVQRILLSKEINKRKIRVTDNEVFQQITQNPQSLPPGISQNPQFMTDGKFDMAKYRQALDNPQVDWTPVEAYVREVLPFQKLQTIVTASVMVTEEEVKEEYISRNQKAKIDYLFIPTSAFAKDSIEVSDSEIKNYYDNHKDEFKIEEHRKLNYVLFSTNPSSEDTARTYQLAEDIKKDAEAGQDFSKLADEYSDDPSVTQNHGDLGYFEKGRMVPEFAEAAFSGKPGQIIGPVKTNYGLHIIKIIDRKEVNGEEQVHAAHILIKFTASPLTLEDAQERAKKFEDMAKDEGFQASADMMKYQIQQTPDMTDQEYMPGFGKMSSAMRWAFKADVNDVSTVYRSTSGYVIFELASIAKAGYRSFDEVENTCKNKVEQAKRTELARAYAQKFKEEVDQDVPFNKIAASDESKIVVSDSTTQFTMSQAIPKIGRAPEITAAAFTLEPGKVSPLLETSRGFYYIRVVERTPFDEQAFQQQYNTIRNRLLSQKSQRFFNEWFEELKKQANIEDNRDRFFAS